MTWIWLAVLIVALGGATACVRSQTAQDGLPSVLSNFPADLASGEVHPHGVWPDGWIDRETRITLRQPGGKTALVLKAAVPAVQPGFGCELRIFVDSEEIGRRSVEPGEVFVQAPVAAAAGKRRVELRFSADQRLPQPDGRSVAARVIELGFVPIDKPARAGLEITDPGSGVQLGNGWNPLETFAGETFRWVNNDAVIRLQPHDQLSRKLSVEIEMGPGFDWKPFTLRVINASGAQVAAAEVRKRQKVQFDLPVAAAAETEYRLHVDGGGKPAKGDPRILNFRVFSIAGA